MNKKRIILIWSAILSFTLFVAGMAGAANTLAGPAAETATPLRAREGSLTPGAAPAEQSSMSREGASDSRANKAVPAAKEGRSEFEKFMTGNGAASVSLDIRQFGYGLFENPPSTFAPVQQVPVGPDYVLGPGDSMKIEIWGKVEGTWSVVVDNDGNISLPKIGVLGVTGLTFKELKDTLFQQISKYYTGFQMNVSMGSLRTIRVYVVGNAQRPGAYTISSLSTIINALFESGGPSKTGSLRAIQLKRSGKTTVTFDLYDFLLKGDKSNDVRLMPEDVIFIPPVGPLAGIAGTVRTPAIYELRGEVRLLDLIQMAGGLTGVAFTGRVQMHRIENHHLRTVFEGDLIDIEKKKEKNFTLQDGDLAKISSVTDSANTVSVSGAIVYPGEYGVNPGVTTIKDIISLAGGRLYFASDKAELTRLTVTQGGPRTDILSVDLSKALEADPKENIALQMNDYLFVRAVPEWGRYRTVIVNGEVKFPGTYTIRRGEALSSVIDRAGGFTSRAYLDGSLFSREQVREQQQKQIEEMSERLERELFGSGSVQVASASSPDDAKIIQMELEQKRRFIEQLKTAKAKGRIALHLTELSSFRGSAYDIELEQGDSLTVPSDPKTVQVIGSVYNQSAFVHERGKDYGYYVDLAGGYSSNADAGNTYVLQANGAAAKASSSFFGFGGRLSSGDTIVVPERTESIAWMRNIKDLTQILYQIAVTAGVLIVIH